MKHLLTTALLFALAIHPPVSALAQATAPTAPSAQERPYGREKGREFRRELSPETKAVIARQDQEAEQLRDRLSPQCSRTLRARGVLANQRFSLELRPEIVGNRMRDGGNAPCHLLLGSRAGHDTHDGGVA